MKNTIHNELKELVANGLITQQNADLIGQYYQKNNIKPQNRLVAVFGILGALLVGLGIMLIVAHNWDKLNVSIKTVLAFLPLTVGQGFCIYSLWKKPDNTNLKEGSAVFTMIGLGTSIALMSQIYNNGGSLESFMFWWMILSVGIVYLMRSDMASLLYIIGITWFGSITGYGYKHEFNFEYWALLLLIVPYYYLLIKRAPKGNYTFFHHWLIPLSVTIVFGTLAISHEEWMLLAYFGLFLLWQQVAALWIEPAKSKGELPYLIIGSFGCIAILMSMTFHSLWEDLLNDEGKLSILLKTPEFVLCILLFFINTLIWFYKLRRDGFNSTLYLQLALLLVYPIFYLGFWFSGFVTLITNLLVLAIGLFALWQGAHRQHLGLLNYGLLIIAVLITCRYFDTQIPFIIRGLMFVALGLAFFFTNYLTLKRRKYDETT